MSRLRRIPWVHHQVRLQCIIDRINELLGFEIILWVLNAKIKSYLIWR